MEKDDKGVSTSIYFHENFQIPSSKIDREMYILVITLLSTQCHIMAKNVQNMQKCNIARYKHFFAQNVPIFFANHLILSLVLGLGGHIIDF